jgi:hypothetical protein
MLAAKQETCRYAHFSSKYLLLVCGDRAGHSLIVIVQCNEININGCCLRQPSTMLVWPFIGIMCLRGFILFLLEGYECESIYPGLCCTLFVNLLFELFIVESRKCDSRNGRCWIETQCQDIYHLD